jgi:hypothetical protein
VGLFRRLAQDRLPRRLWAAAALAALAGAWIAAG